MANGIKTGGRQAGTPNKVSADVRAVMADLAAKHAPQVSTWLLQIKDPAKRIELYLRMLEYSIPKLGRTEHAIDGGSVGLLAADIRADLHRRLMSMLKIEPKPDGDPGPSTRYERVMSNEPVNY